MPLADPLRILFVVNPVSGKGSKGDTERQIHQYFKGKPHAIEFYQLTGTDTDQSSIRYWLREWNATCVVAVGGDGTLKSVAEILLHSGIPVGLLPAGSANGMALELGIPEDLSQSLDIIVDGHTQPIDIIRFSDRQISLHLSDFGLNAKLIKHFEQSDYRGMWGYAREVWKVMKTRQRFRVQITTEAGVVFRYAWMVVIANARKYGTGALINPKGDLQDGKLEVIVVKTLSFGELFKMVLKRRRLNPEKTEVIQASEVSLVLKKSVYFQIDGEYCGKQRKINAAVEHGALKMILPEGAPAQRS